MTKYEAAQAEVEALELRAEAKHNELVEIRKALAVARERLERMADPRKAISSSERVVDTWTSAVSLFIEERGGRILADDVAAEFHITRPRATNILLYLEDLGQLRRTRGDRAGGLAWVIADPEETRVRDYVARHREGTVAELASALGESEDEARRYLETQVAKGAVALAGNLWSYVEPGPERQITRRSAAPAPERELAGEQRDGAAVPLTGKAKGTTHSPMRDKALLKGGHRVRTPSNKGTRIKGRGGKAA